MTEYDYFIAGFSAANDSDLLRQLIIAQVEFAPTFSYLDVNVHMGDGPIGCDISVRFTAPLSEPSQALLGGFMAIYMTSVSVVKIKKLRDLKTSVQNYIDNHYDSITRQQLINLYMLAKFDGLKNRSDYIRPGLDWINSILAYAASSTLAIQAIQVVNDVNAYPIDINGNVTADPLLTVSAAVLIMN